MTSFLWRTKMPPLLENRLSLISFLKKVRIVSTYMSYMVKDSDNTTLGGEYSSENKILTIPTHLPI